MKKLIGIFSVLVLFQGCNEERNTLINENDEFSINKNLSYSARFNEMPIGEDLILGEKLKNPYTVVNMTAAMEQYAEICPNAEIHDITATHQYIKILPRNEEDIEYLQELEETNATGDNEFIVHEYPLDYKILQEGEGYKDPEYTGDEIYKPLWTVIPIDFQLNVPYEIIDEIYKPQPNEEDLETIAMANAGWTEELEEDFGEIVTPENVKNFISCENIANKSNKFTPNGTINVHNNDTGTAEGFRNAKLRIGRFIWWHNGSTNANGYFIDNRTYRGIVMIRSSWKNPGETIRKSWNEIIGVDISDHLFGLTKNNNGIYWTFNQNNEHLYLKAVTHNSVEKYNQYMLSQGVTPLSDANIWVSTKSNASSTPMLKKFIALPIIANYATMTQGNVWNTIVSNLFNYTIQILPNFIKPDQILSFGGQKMNSRDYSTRRMEQLIFHESGHFSHAMKAGTYNYSKIYGAELKNQISYGHPYHQGNTPSVSLGQQIALAEGWATVTEHKTMQNYYGTSFDRGSWQNLPYYIDNFRMYQTPMTATRYDNASFFTTGLMWDLIDNTNNETGSFLVSGDGISQIGQIVDNVYLGNSLGLIFSKMTSSCYNAYDLKSSLAAAYPSQTTQINQLFSSYGY